MHGTPHSITIPELPNQPVSLRRIIWLNKTHYSMYVPAYLAVQVPYLGHIGQLHDGWWDLLKHSPRWAVRMCGRGAGWAVHTHHTWRQCAGIAEERPPGPVGLLGGGRGALPYSYTCHMLCSIKCSTSDLCISSSVFKVLPYTISLWLVSGLKKYFAQCLSMLYWSASPVNSLWNCGNLLSSTVVAKVLLT